MSPGLPGLPVTGFTKVGDRIELQRWRAHVRDIMTYAGIRKFVSGSIHI
jgi:hypothetical protein